MTQRFPQAKHDEPISPTKKG